ncbi:hypothetical protein BD770DRAFT_381800 [Pilaira anomala]|nr:hypothetical protein BD770DRAFT_381800 [Pilaira anomala]
MTMEEDGPLPLQFQLLYNGEVETSSETVYKHKARMYATFKVELNETPIYRLIHYEFERHFISAGQLFKSCGLTITEGFFLFEIKLNEFEVDFLISQFPYCDIWVSVEQARSMALALGVEQELELFLGEELDECYSSDNMGRNEIMHNWIVPSIPNLQYSTRALLETTFDVIKLLEPPNRKIRTQISRANTQVMKDRTETGLVRWQVWAYEQFLQQNNTTIKEDISSIGLDRSGAVWDTLQGLLSDLHTVNRGGKMIKNRVLSDNMMVGNMPLKKEYLGHSLALQQLYIAVMIEKIMNEFNRVNKEDIVHQARTTMMVDTKATIANSSSTSTATTATTISSKENDNNRVVADTNMLFHDRLDLLEQELYKVKRRSKRKLEEIQSYQDELTQQLNELNSWKSQSDRIRKSERVWMLMCMVCVVFGVLSLRTFYFA